MNLPSLRHLRHLVALVDQGHFGRAAAVSGVTQSTLSASIKELESLLEATLVDRSKRRVVLTPLGLEIVERARRVTREVEELALVARAAREPLTGVLRMGVIPTIGPFLLPRVLPGLRHAYGQLRLFLVEDLTARLIEALHQGKLDVVLLALPYDWGRWRQRSCLTTLSWSRCRVDMRSSASRALNRNASGVTTCCCSRMATASAIMHLLPVVLLTDIEPKHSKRQVSRHSCRWLTTGLALRCCPSLPWRPGCYGAPVS